VSDAKPQRVFVTGALGFIGRRLMERYRDAGAEVAGLDVRADAALDVVAGDLAQPGPWQDAMARSDLVIHTAALVGMGPDEERSWRINVLGTRHALDAAARAGARRFVHFSSIVTFGFDFQGTVDETYPVRANGVAYVDTKIASEQVVLAAHAAGEMECAIVRPGDVYGPGSHFWTATPVREIKARRLVLPAMGRGMLSPVFVDDLLDGVTLAASRDEAAGQVFTLTGPRSVPARDFFVRYARMLGRRRVPAAPTGFVTAMASAVQRISSDSEVTPAAARYLARTGSYSIEKARSRLGYEPRVDLDEGMRRSEEWLQAEGILADVGT
jgi:nucleoside-diphosphate-sugar epimerase